MKLLVAYDGSHGGETALADLAHAGLAPGTEILVLTVAEHALPAVSPSNAPLPTIGELAPHPSPTPREAEAAERALGICRHGVALARERLPAAHVEGLVCGGSMATAILLHADAWAPDLIVVGSRGRPRPVRALLGSVARRVVTEARCSVRVARPSDSPPDAPQRILVGHDGRSGGSAALGAAASRAWPEGSEMLVFAVSSPDVMTVFAGTLEWSAPWPIQEPRVDRRSLGDAIEADAARIRRTGLAVNTLIRAGDVASVLIRNARSWRADSVFVGATAMTRAERFLLGSVSGAVSDRARCSVEVVRAPAAAAAAATAPAA